MMKVALYARVSSEKQAEKDLSISAQLKALRAHAEKQGCQVYREFIDEAESARSADRPAFQEMIALTKGKEKPFSAILVWKLSRFARNREDSIIYKSLLKKRGVRVISINEQVDETAAGKLLEGIIEVIDEFYSLNLAEDTIRGLRENASRGFKNGSIPIGYKSKKVADGNNQRTTLEPDEIYSPVIKRIFQLCIENKGIKEIAKTLNREGLKTKCGKPWSNASVGYILRNEVYAGTLIYGKKGKRKTSLNGPDQVVRITDNHPAIIDKECFENVQRLMAKRSPVNTHPRALASDYLLSGMLYCGKCGSKMIGCSAKSGQNFYYACHNYLKRGKDICDMKLVNRAEIEHLTIDRLKALVLTEQNLSEIFNIVLDELRCDARKNESELKSVEDQLEGLQRRRSKLYDSLETGKLAIEDIAPRIKEINAQIEAIEVRRKDLFDEISNPKPIPLNINKLKEYAQDLAELLWSSPIMEQKEILRSFVKRIIVNPPDVKIDYTLPMPEERGETTEVGSSAYMQNWLPGPDSNQQLSG